MGKAGLDGGVAPAQRIVFGVGNQGRVFGVIGAVVAGDFLREPGEFVGRFGFGQCVDFGLWVHGY